MQVALLLQVLREATRKGALLDLLFVNRDNIMCEVMIGGCLGHSNHEMVEFKIFGDMRKIVIRATSLDFGRADFKLLKEAFSKVP